MKQCEQCKLTKKDIAFKGKKTICRKCVNEKNRIRFGRMVSSPLDIEQLNNNLETIKVFSFQNHTELKLEDALNVINNNKGIVYSPDTVVLTNEIRKYLVKEDVLDRDDYTCHYCGKDGDTVDHIIPNSIGGNYDEQNLVASCRVCNHLKKDMGYEEFKMQQRKLISEFKYREKLKRKKSPTNEGKKEEVKSELDKMIEAAFKNKST